MKERKQMPPVALGTWSWGVGAAGGDQIFGNTLGEAELRPVFETAMRHGLNLWDTAYVYGRGASENILGAFLREHSRDDVILSTKFTPRIASDCADPVAEMCEGSLKRLGVDEIDLYWIHAPADVERWTPLLLPLVKSGKVKRVGVSNHNMEQIKRVQEILGAEGVQLSAVQNHYSLLYRSSEDAGILDYCKQNGIDFYAYMVLEQGALCGKYDTAHPLPAGSQRAEAYNDKLPQIEKLVAVMRAVGQRHGASVSQVAIAWTVSKGVIPLIGVTKPAHAEDAAKAAALVLTAEETAQLEQAAAETGVDTRGYWEVPMA